MHFKYSIEKKNKADNNNNISQRKRKVQPQKFATHCHNKDIRVANRVVQIYKL